MRNYGVGVDKIALSNYPSRCGRRGRQAAKLAQVSTPNNREENNAVNSRRNSRRGWVEEKG